MAQTDYNDMPQGQAGDLGYAAGGSDHTVLTYNVVTGGEIKPGLGVGKISGDDNGVKLTDASSIQFLGVATRDTSEENSDSGDFTYDSESALGVCRRGTIYVTVEENVTPDDDVFVRFDAEPEVFTILWDGDFVTANDVDGNINGDAIATVPFDTDQATTIANVATAIQALDSVSTATVTDTREITVTGSVDGVDLSSNSSFVVTGGASQATETITNSTGPSEGTQNGVFRTDADTGAGATAFALPNCKFLTSGSAGGVALLDLNIA